MHKNSLEIAAWSISGTVTLMGCANALMKRNTVPQMGWKDKSPKMSQSFGPWVFLFDKNSDKKKLPRWDKSTDSNIQSHGNKLWGLWKTQLEFS